MKMFRSLFVAAVACAAAVPCLAGSEADRVVETIHKAMEDYGLKGIMFDTADIFTDDKGVEHFPLYAAAFMDCIDPQDEIVIDFSSVDDLNGMFT